MPSREITEEVLVAILYAKEWSEWDPNPKTSSYVKNLIDNKGEDGVLEKLLSLFPISPGSKIEDYNPRLQPRIGFGTAGLRGHMEPGPMGMNDLVVIQTAQGLASYVIRCHNRENLSGPIKAVVGYDHRSHSGFNLSSKQFAIYTKLAFEDAGIECTLLDGYVATPILAYAVTNLNADVGVMVTASHNPKQDNGYKVYWKDGCQIRPPLDEGIAKTINEDLNLFPGEYAEKLQELMGISPNDGCYGLSDPIATKRIEDAYYLSILTSGLVPEDTGINDKSSSGPRFAYTAMHGVGYPYAKRSFETFYLPPFLAVPTQQHPDPNFSTVPFPNPEEKGALDQAMAFAAENECDIVLANDPDADRLGVAELIKDRSSLQRSLRKDSGKWTVFTGDQIGTLLGHWLWETIGKKSDKPVAMCASTVSSKMLKAMGETEGFRFVETLTGFKWIGSQALALQNKGYRVLLGYEEAIGFSCGGIIPDKDGISAIGVIATMAHHVYASGETLVSQLQKIHDKYGEFVSNNGYYRCDDPAIVKSVMKQMRNRGNYFGRVGPYDVESVRDLGSPGYDSSAPDKKATLPTSESSPMITFRFVNGCVAQFRASGTEPKFKYYIEMRGQPGEEKSSVEKRLSEMSSVILEELLHPSANCLVLPSHL